MKHSRLGIASVCLSAVPIVTVAVLFAVCYAVSGLLGEDFTANPPQIVDDVIGPLALLVGVVCAPIAGLILGIIGLCLKGRKRLFPIVGTIANASLIAAILSAIMYLSYQFSIGNTL